MATLNTVRTLVAGRGHIFTAPVDTDPFDLDAFEFGDDLTYGTWDWLGDVQEETPVEFTSEGGEATTLNTWDREAVKAIYSPTSISGTITKVDLSVESFMQAFPGSARNDERGSVRVGSNPAAAERALMLVTYDSVDIAGLYLPRVSWRGQMPVFNREAFSTLPLNLSVLGSLTDIVPGAGSLRYEWMEPRPIVGSAG